MFDGDVVATDVGDCEDFTGEVYECDLQFLRSKDHDDQDLLEFCEFATAIR